jgi:hypothetical protein
MEFVANRLELIGDLLDKPEEKGPPTVSSEETMQ